MQTHSEDAAGTASILPFPSLAQSPFKLLAKAVYQQAVADGASPDEAADDAMHAILTGASPDDPDHRPPAAPTLTTRPGTEARIKVMRERYLDGEDLYHPTDARWEPEDAIALEGGNGRNGRRKVKRTLIMGWRQAA